MHQSRPWYAICAGVLLILACLASAAPAARAGTAAPSRARGATLTSFPVAFLLCDEKGWNYHPESLSYYQDMWTKQDSAGTYASLADYFRDESYGQMSMAGSKVLGYYQMSMTAGDYGDNELIDRWESCANAALAAGVDLTAFKSVVTVQPTVLARVTGSGIADWTSASDWPAGKAHPNPETFTVDTTAHWPPAPFCLILKSIGTYGQNAWVTGYSGDKVTVTRGRCGSSQSPLSSLVAVPAGQSVQSNTSDDQAYVGPQSLYVRAGGQECASGHSRCPVVSFSGGTGTTPLAVGVAGLNAGVVNSDGEPGNGVGDSAHEVGHTTGYNHSRALSSSQTDYRDCYDEMSYNACGLPDLPGLAGPPDTIIGYDAPDLEAHGWIPASKQFNSTDSSFAQTTITLHALSDPNALHDPGYLDAHLPAKVQIEDITPSTSTPATYPPSNCTAQGYGCEYSSYYTVEYRQRYAFDQELTARDNDGNYGPVNGAVILHLVVPHPSNCADYGPCNISYLVDSQPDEGTGGKPAFLPNGGAFQPGMDFADPAHHVYVGVNSFDPATRSARVTVSSSPILPALMVNGPSQAEAGAKTTLSATLTADGAPVPGQKVSLTVGTGPSCSGQTNSSGKATCQVTLGSTATLTTLDASFGGDQAYHSATGFAQTQVWTPATAVSAVPSAGSTTAPAVAWLGSQWFAAWRDATSGDIYWSADSGSGWTAPVALVVSGKTITTAHAPAVASDDGIPVIAWTAANGDIEYSGFALLGWSGPSTVSGSWGTAVTNHGPAFAAMGEHGFIAAWAGATSKHVYYAEYSDGAWQPQQHLSFTTTSYAPAVTAATGSITLAYLAWTNANGTVGLERVRGTTLTTLADVPSAKTSNGPALTSGPGAGAIFVAWDGASSQHVYYTQWIGGTWYPQRDEPQALTTQAPVLAASGQALRMLWTVPAANTVEEAQTAG